MHFLIHFGFAVGGVNLGGGDLYIRVTRGPVENLKGTFKKYTNLVKWAWLKLTLENVPLLRDVLLFSLVRGASSDK